MRRALLIDWRGQFEALGPFLESMGGVIKVNASDAAPASNFAKAVRKVMDDSDGPRAWCSVQVDPGNSNTHYLDDIVTQIERKLDLEALPVGAPLAAPDIAVANHIRSRGDIEIRDIRVEVRGGMNRATELRLRTDRIAQCIRERADTLRVALIFVESHKQSKDTLGDICRELWEPVLAELIDPAGVLLIDISDPTQQVVSRWPPDPDLTLSLPERYEGPDRDSAIEDVARVLAATGSVEPADAQIQAGALVDASSDVRQLHGLVSRLLTRPNQP